MEKLKEVIEKYQGWSFLSDNIKRIETFIDSDFSICVENAKALLESIGTEICERKEKPLKPNSSMNGVLKNAFIVLGYSNTNMVNQISGSLANIGQNVGVLRNEISPISHGRSQIKYDKRNDGVDELSQEFLIDSVIIVASFLIKAYENTKPLNEQILGSDTKVPNKIEYFQAEDFNNFLDDSYGVFEMGEYSFIASEILYNCDYNDYEIEFNNFRSIEKIG